MSGATIANLLGCGGGAPGVINALNSANSAIGSCGWELQNDGDFVYSNGAGTETGDWVTPSETATAAFYEIQVDATSGTFSSGTTGSYVALSTTRSWTKDSGTVIFNYSIREIATGVVRGSGTGLSLTAP